MERVKKPRGTCPLCRQPGRELLESHLLPKQVSLRAWGRGLTHPEPRVLTESGVQRTVKQIRQPFLCVDCEDLLNRKGESHVLGVSFFEPGRFPLQDILAGQEAIAGDSEHRAYAGVEIEDLDVDKLAHYGAGIFWKAGAGEWYSYDNPEPVHIDLGPYEEDLRRYVLDDAPLPGSMVLTLCVSPVVAPEYPWPLGAPPRRIRPGIPGCHHHSFHALGLKYDLFVGGRIPEGPKRLCLINSPERIISMSAGMEAIARRVYDPGRPRRRQPRRPWAKVRR